MTRIPFEPSPKTLSDLTVPTPPRSVGPYELLERLGAGGLGEVWKARDRVLNRVIALKFLATPRRGASPLQDLLREARAASALNHPNIVTIFEVGEGKNGTYLAMEFVEGETLRDRMRRAPLALDEALDIAEQIVAGLGSAHAHGIVHRDLKPENIMLRVDGYVKLVDFGLAKVLPGALASAGDQPTEDSGDLAGTYTYMSPEQARGQPVGASTDVFSLGIVLYELVTGEHPFRGQTVLETLNAIIGNEPVSLRVKSPSAPPVLDEIVSNALRKDPGDRYPSAVEMMEPLKRARSAGAAGTVSSGLAPVRRRPSRWTQLAGGVLLSALALATGWHVLRSSGPETMPAARSVAIMTFRTDPGDARAATLAQGLPEDLGGALSATGLLVASRSSVLELGTSTNARTVGAELGVDAVIEGTVRSYGSKFKIHIELVNARTRFQVWSGTFTSDGEDLLGTEQQTAGEIAARLRAMLAGPR